MKHNEHKRLLTILILLVIGVFINKEINIFLKEWIKEPLDPKVFGERKKNKYGNPSGHAQFYSFLFFFTLFFLYRTYRDSTITNICFMVVILLYLRTIYVCLTYGYHTPKQLLFGTFMGFFVCYVYSIISYLYILH